MHALHNDHMDIVQILLDHARSKTDTLIVQVKNRILYLFCIPPLNCASNSCISFLRCGLITFK